MHIYAYHCIPVTYLCILFENAMRGINTGNVSLTIEKGLVNQQQSYLVYIKIAYQLHTMHIPLHTSLPIFICIPSIYVLHILRIDVAYELKMCILTYQNIQFPYQCICLVKHMCYIHSAYLFSAYVAHTINIPVAYIV